MSESTTQTTETPTLSLTDLQNVLVVIDLASNRGAFRGAELASVGLLFAKIDAFVKSMTPSQNPVDNSQVQA